MAFMGNFKDSTPCTCGHRADQHSLLRENGQLVRQWCTDDCYCSKYTEKLDPDDAATMDEDLGDDTKEEIEAWADEQVTNLTTAFSETLLATREGFQQMAGDEDDDSWIDQATEATRLYMKHQLKAKLLEALRNL